MRVLISRFERRVSKNFLTFIFRWMEWFLLHTPSSTITNKQTETVGFCSVNNHLEAMLRDFTIKIAYLIRANLKENRNNKHSQNH